MWNPGVVPMICFTCSIHFVSFAILPFPSGVYTIIEPLLQPSCTDRIARVCVSDFKIDVHGAASSVGVKNITLGAEMLQRFTQHTLQNFDCNGPSLSELTSHNPLGTWTQHFPESTNGRSSRHPTANSTSPLTDQVSHECPLAPHLPCIPEKTPVDELGNSVESIMTLLHT